MALGSLERGVVHLYLFVQQWLRLDVGLDLIGFEQGVTVLVDHLNVIGGHIKREFNVDVPHTDIHAGFFAGILCCNVGGFVLHPWDICGKRQSRYHTQ